MNHILEEIILYMQTIYYIYEDKTYTTSLIKI